jgi:FtsP/CotA-like multicopper oxidase with cupredoxin domain
LGLSTSSRSRCFQRNDLIVQIACREVERIAFDANNPGRWAFHCHNLYHMQTGMMTDVRYDGIAA